MEYKYIGIGKSSKPNKNCLFLRITKQNDIKFYNNTKIYINFDNSLTERRILFSQQDAETIPMDYDEISIEFPIMIFKNKLDNKCNILKLNDIRIINLESIKKLSFETEIFSVEVLIPFANSICQTSEILFKLFDNIFEIFNKYKPFFDYIKFEQNNNSSIYMLFNINSSNKTDYFEFSAYLSCPQLKKKLLKTFNEIELDFYFDIIGIYFSRDSVSIRMKSGTHFNLLNTNCAEFLKYINWFEISKDKVIIDNHVFKTNMFFDLKSEILNVMKFRQTKFYKLITSLLNQNAGNASPKSFILFSSILNKYKENFEEINKLIELFEL